VHVFDQFDAEADFREGDSADEQVFKWLRTDEGNDLRLGSCSRRKSSAAMTTTSSRA
jgi:hypothetical protein